MIMKFKKFKEDKQVKKSTLSYQFNHFSLMLYLIISTISIGAFVLSSYNVGMTNIEQKVTFAAESVNLSVAETMNSELGYIIKLSNSYVIQDYFNDPNNEDKRNKAFSEFDYYHTAFLAEKDVFWVNDIEHMFYSTYSDSYYVDPSLPENYWYNFTLYDTEYYNFNVNYNPDLQRTTLWINAPVFQKTTFGETAVPTGMLGTGVDLVDFSTKMFSDLDHEVEVFLFNKDGEITVSENLDHVVDKVKIQSLFGDTGSRIYNASKNLTLNENNVYNFESNGKLYSISYITSMDWFVCASYPINTANIFDNSSTLVFILMYIALLIVYLLIFFFIRKISKMLEMRQEELMQSKIEAETANKAKSDFLAIMSHEIRTPLNAIIGVSQIILSSDIHDKHRESIEKINSSGNSLLAIINDILDLSKIESGRLEVHPEVFDIPSLIYDTVMLNIIRIGNKPIEMKLEVDEHLPSELYGDELRIKQIMNNLLSNAFKYTDKGTVRLAVSGHKKDDFYVLTLTVSDTGQGMRQKDLKRLFTEYSRFNLSHNRSTEGTGLGMTITKRLVRMMDGDINVTSVFGKGSEFIVTLHLQISNDEVIGKETKEHLEQFMFIKNSNEAASQVLIKPMPYGNVLIVDDIETNLFVAKGLIEPYRIKVETLTSGQETIALIRSGRSFDIIFMDHMMPGLDGVKTTEIIRSLGYEKPIIALTANAIVGAKSLFLENGFNGYISKPIDLRDLNKYLVRYVLESHKDEAEKFEKSKMPTPASSKVIPIGEQIIKAFTGDVTRRLPVIVKTSKERDFQLFATTVHGIKSAAANCGLTEISECAKELETAGKNQDTVTIDEKAPVLINMLKEFLRQNSGVFDKTFAASDDSRVSSLLTALKQSCNDYDENEAENIISQIRNLEHTQKTGELLDKVENHILHSEFEEAYEEL
ncbi:MAG: response regulator [Ruminococcus sp.]|jgi:signal transduction histidine kinase/CheY-like chemotaxis protein|nr:response regulator [Ruminococcus sp.]